MSPRMFFPSSPLSLSFVILLIAWFLFWLRRLQLEAAHLSSIEKGLQKLDACVSQLRLQQGWRDRKRIQGEEAQLDPGIFFDETCVRSLKPEDSVSAVLLNHFRAIFVAGCDESLLDSVELNAQTSGEIAGKSQQLRTELVLMLLFGLLGTLMQLFARYSSSALPPLIWGLGLTIAGGILYLRHERDKLEPAIALLRRKTTTLWIPRLYPTVAQRAAQWATHTLQNAARATDASAVIEKHALGFVSAVENARSAAEMFSTGMREFSRGIQASDQALQKAQTRLASEVEKFSDSLQRWGKFEDEISRFYTAVEAQQKQLVGEHKTFEAMLAGYYDLVRQTTNTLQKAAADVSAAANSLPEAFRATAQTMHETVQGVGTVVAAAYREESSSLQARLHDIVQPVIDMEDRLRALGTPFEAASNNLTEVATNLWRLNDSFSRDMREILVKLQTERDHIVS